MTDMESMKCLFIILAEPVEFSLLAQGHGVRNVFALPKLVQNLMFFQNCFVPLRAPSIKKIRLAFLTAVVTLLRSILYFILWSSDGDLR